MREQFRGIRRFQSTLPRGERHKNHRDVCSDKRYFNPRSREGSDGTTRGWNITDLQFQSTLPRGERLYSRETYSRIQNFNPRSREGSDGTWRNFTRTTAEISIHAPARGATASNADIAKHLQISIHAPARGATDVFRQVRGILGDFNPRSREGSDFNFI